MKAKTWLFIALCSVGISVSAQSDSYSTQAITKDLDFFKDWTATELTGNFKSKQLDKFQSPLMKQLAIKMGKGDYQSQYKLHTYHAIPSTKVLEEKLKLSSGYSQYENITGIYLEQGENVVLVGDLHGRDISLLIPDWTRQPTLGFAPTKDPEGWGLKKQEISLHEGVNVINVRKSGNVYLNYYADDPEAAPGITIHFVTGKVNGYFDASTQSNKEWNKLLDNAVGPIMDVKTRYMQLAYPVEFLKKFAYGKGTELAEDYDKIMQQQYQFMGAVKYDKVINKRILARVNYNYYMFRDGDGVAFLGNEGTMKMAIGPDVTTNWGVNHEIGHVMQMRPQLTWGGMTEVSNNLFSMYATMNLGSPSRLSKQKVYEAAFKQVLDAGQKQFILSVSDPFHKLIPFWQLQIYFKSKGYTDFYADLMEHMRTHPHKGTGNASIHNMYEFIKVCCDLTKTDLTEFFDQWGFFETGKFEIKDYSKYDFDITPKMIEEVKQYVASKNYPKPDKDITRLTD